jgi:hypothetical protein
MGQIGSHNDGSQSHYRCTSFAAWLWKGSARIPPGGSGGLCVATRTRDIVSMHGPSSRSLNARQAILSMRSIKRECVVARSRPVFFMLIGRRITASRARGGQAGECVDEGTDDLGFCFDISDNRQESLCRTLFVIADPKDTNGCPTNSDVI